MTEVDVSDPRAVRHWAQLICRGGDIEAMARSLQVPATVDSLVEALTRGFPKESASVVRAVCREELS